MRIRDFLEIDFILLIASIVLMGIGILFVYSSGITSEGILISSEYKKQIIWSAAGIIIALMVAIFNYRRIYDLSIYLYLATLLLLIYTCVFGRIAYGTRWLRLGSFGIQASEFAKITTILFLAWYLDSTRRSQRIFVRFMVSCLIVFIPMLIILIQPDLGTALVFLPILIGMTFIAGISKRYIIFLGLCVIFTGILLVLPLWQGTIMGNAFPALMMIVNKRFIAVCCLALSLIAAIAWFGFIRFRKR